MTSIPATPACTNTGREDLCPGPAETLRHEEAWGLSRKNLAFHIVKCHPCLTSTLRCIHAGCNAAVLPFSGDARNASEVPPPDKWEGLLLLWYQDVATSLKWPLKLPPWQFEELRDGAIVHVWVKVLLPDPRGNERFMTGEGSIRAFIKKVMSNYIIAVGRKKTPKEVALVRLSDDEEQDLSPVLLPPTSSTEQIFLLKNAVEAIQRVFQEHYDQLTGKPDHQFIFDQWLTRRLHPTPEGGLTQKALADLLHQERLRRGDHPTRPNQATISRWINSSRLAITAMLGDPARGIEESFRETALDLIAPNRHPRP